MQGCSSAGRAWVSKTRGRRFDPCRPCHSVRNVALCERNAQKCPLNAGFFMAIFSADFEKEENRQHKDCFSQIRHAQVRSICGLSTLR